MPIQIAYRRLQLSSDDVFQELSARYRAVEPEQWLQRHPEASSSWPSWPKPSHVGSYGLFTCASPAPSVPRATTPVDLIAASISEKYDVGDLRSDWQGKLLHD